MMKKYFASINEEGPFYVGPCKTEKEAIEEAKTEYAEQIAEGSQIHIGKSRVVQLCIDGDSVIDDVANSYYDELYEDALDSWCNKVSRASKDELGRRLTEVFHKWLEEQGEEYEFDVIETICKPATDESEGGK